MFLENCCFGRRELMVLNMVDQGVLGEVVHCAGGYQHDLRDEIAFGKETDITALETICPETVKTIQPTIWDRSPRS